MHTTNATKEQFVRLATADRDEAQGKGDVWRAQELAKLLDEVKGAFDSGAGLQGLWERRYAILTRPQAEQLELAGELAEVKERLKGYLSMLNREIERTTLLKESVEAFKAERRDMSARKEELRRRVEELEAERETREFAIAHKNDHISKLEDALAWMSGSQDFATGGKARDGFEKLVKPLLGGRAAYDMGGFKQLPSYGTNIERLVAPEGVAQMFKSDMDKIVSLKKPTKEQMHVIDLASGDRLDGIARGVFVEFMPAPWDGPTGCRARWPTARAPADGSSPKAKRATQVSSMVWKEIERDYAKCRELAPDFQVTREVFAKEGSCVVWRAHLGGQEFACALPIRGISAKVLLAFMLQAKQSLTFVVAIPRDCPHVRELVLRYVLPSQKHLTKDERKDMLDHLVVCIPPMVAPGSSCGMFFEDKMQQAHFKAKGMS
jgi:hypothetical protein